MEEKPEFRRYIKVQSDPYYKVTGIIKGENGGKQFYEINYERSKYITDTFLDVLFIILLLVGFFVYISFDEAVLNHTGYDPDLGTKIIIIGIALALWHSFLVPFLTRLLRYAFVFRWHFTQFSDFQSDKRRSYLEFYNNFISDEIGFTFKKEREAKKEILKEYYINDPNAERKIFKAIKVINSILGFVIYFFVLFLFFIKKITIIESLVLFFFSLIVLKLLIQLAVNYFWNAEINKKENKSSE